MPAPGIACITNILAAQGNRRTVHSLCGVTVGNVLLGTLLQHAYHVYTSTSMYCLVPCFSMATMSIPVHQCIAWYPASARLPCLYQYINVLLGTLLQHDYHVYTGTSMCCLVPCFSMATMSIPVHQCVAWYPALAWLPCLYQYINVLLGTLLQHDYHVYTGTSMCCLVPCFSMAAMSIPVHQCIAWYPASAWLPRLYRYINVLLGTLLQHGCHVYTGTSMYCLVPCFSMATMSIPVHQCIAWYPASAWLPCLYQYINVLLGTLLQHGYHVYTRTSMYCLVPCFSMATMSIPVHQCIAGYPASAWLPCLYQYINVLLGTLLQHGYHVYTGTSMCCLVPCFSMAAMSIPVHQCIAWYPASAWLPCLYQYINVLLGTLLQHGYHVYTRTSMYCLVPCFSMATMSIPVHQCIAWYPASACLPCLYQYINVLLGTLLQHGYHVYTSTSMYCLVPCFSMPTMSIPVHQCIAWYPASAWLPCLYQYINVLLGTLLQHGYHVYTSTSMYCLVPCFSMAAMSIPVHQCIAWYPASARLPCLYRYIPPLDSCCTGMCVAEKHG